MQPDLNQKKPENGISQNPEPLSESGAPEDGMKEASYGGYKYKWEYDEYQRNIRRKTAVREKSAVDIVLVVLTAFFILCVFAVSAVIMIDIYHDKGKGRQSFLGMDTPDGALVGLLPDTLTDSTQQRPGAVLQLHPSIVTVNAFSKSGESTESNGVIFTDTGYIAVCESDNFDAQSYSVLYDSREYKAEFVGADPVIGVSVLKIEGENFPCVQFGYPDDLTLSEELYAFKTSDAEKIYGGIVQNVYKSEFKFQDISESVKVIDIHWKSPLNDTSGPVVNARGQVVGFLIFNENFSGSALSAADMLPSVNSIILGVKESNDENSEALICVKTLGIKGQLVTDQASKIYRIPRGIMVKNIYAVSDIKKSGLKQGDIVVSVTSIPITTAEEIDKIVSAYEYGDQITICVYRNENYIDLSFTYTCNE